MRDDLGLGEKDVYHSSMVYHTSVKKIIYGGSIESLHQAEFRTTESTTRFGMLGLESALG